jgi:predicted TIM-barrel fold metal-dependent hydrolase
MLDIISRDFETKFYTKCETNGLLTVIHYGNEQIRWRFRQFEVA